MTCSLKDVFGCFMDTELSVLAMASYLLVEE